MSLMQLFGLLFAVNILTIGGGYVMLPLLHQFFVEDFRVLTNREFLDAVALGQVTPGPLTVMNAFIGYKVMGLAGAVAATAGTYLPSLFVVTLVSRFYVRFKESRVVGGVFRGIKPALAGMLGAVCITLGSVSLTDAPALAIGAASFGLMTFTRIDPTFVILGAAAAGAALL